MRLADFILQNVEPILVEWEAFARTIWPGEETTPADLRDHAAEILRETARDMKSDQTALQQSDKSKGDGDEGESSRRLDRASDTHAAARVRSGFDLLALVAEYRALRASVIRLWRNSVPGSDLRDLDDLTRFNESIDQSLAIAVRSYTERVDQSRKMFLAILGHDLRNPLNSIVVSAEALSMDEKLDADSSSLASQISTSSAAMSKMISDLLDFTGTTLGAAIPLSPAPMNLKSLCEEVVNEMRAGDPKHDLRLQMSGDLSGVWDAARLRQLLSNLVGNALQHGAGVVELSVRSEGDKVLMGVRNDGPVIPPDVIPTIFDPLVRGSTSQKPRRQGSIGLGLHIAREVVTAHRGSIQVRSEPGTGTVFTVHLPRRTLATTS
jgi:signal transduction histidine kinase